MSVEIRKVGTVTVINGLVEDIIEYDQYVWRNNEIKKVTIRVSPDIYGGLPARYELGPNGPIFGMTQRHFDTPQEAVAHEIKALDAQEQLLIEQLEVVRKAKIALEKK